MSSRGLFVSLDGPGGAGKTTVAALVRDQLSARGLPVRLTAEPSSTPLGQLIRANTDTYHGMALACLVAGDRHHHLVAEIRPHWEAGAIVLSDRYLPASLVLQRMDGLDWDTIWQLNTPVVVPDLAVILKTPTQRCSPADWQGAAHTAALSAWPRVRPLNLASTALRPPGWRPSAGTSAQSIRPPARRTRWRL